MGRKAYERGMKTRRKVLGDEWVDAAQRNMTPFNEEFQDLITRYAWDEIWNRPGLPHPVRRMLVLAITVTAGRWDEFKLHMQAALRSGDLTQDEIKEVLLQCAVYAGVPSANHAFREAREVLGSMAAAKKPKRRK
jgi:4-carboxymuconolactone decarboxylase